jgi:hypothetical protein
MENKDSMSGEESLQLIRRMIDTAKQEIDDDSFYYLFWGWLVFSSCLIHYVMLQMNSAYAGISWMILMPLGAVITMIYGRRQDKKSRKRSYLDDLMKYVLISFLVSLTLVLGFGFKLQLNAYPMVMVVYGFWLFVSGGALKFRPLILGGIVNWILAAVAFFFPFEMQLLILAVAVLLGYIIPGHLLKSRYQKQHNVTN